MSHSELSQESAVPTPGPFLLNDFTLELDASPASCKRGREVELRPKLFEPLVSLVEHHDNRLVSEEEYDASGLARDLRSPSDWPLVQCLRDVRRALGDEQQRLVAKTVARRGYLFDALKSFGTLHGGYAECGLLGAGRRRQGRHRRDRRALD